MRIIVLLTALLAANGAQALSCKAYVVLGAYATREQCEKARAETANPEFYRCIQCE